MTNKSEVTLTKVLPKVMTFLGKVAKDNTSPHADEAKELQTQMLLAALLGLADASSTPEGREKVEAALNDKAYQGKGHDPYGR